MKRFIKIYGIALTAIVITGCKKFVEVPPPNTSLVGASAFASNATAASALDGIYYTMANNSIGGNIDGIPALLGLSADEFNVYPGSADIPLVQAYTNSLSPIAPVPTEWADLYNAIYQANSAIDGLTTSTGVTLNMKQQLTGEAKVVRAFCYFYLTNIYGDVPLVTSSNYTGNEAKGRTSQSLIYQQIISDLTDAQGLLSNNYLTPNGTITTERVRPNKAAATALLARVYLYMKNWKDAITQSSVVIGNSMYSLPADLSQVFNTTSSEAIWQLEMPNNGFNAPDANFLIAYLYLGYPVSAFPMTLSDSLISQFESGDKRQATWTVSIVNAGTTYYFPYKYNVYYTGVAPVQYPVLLRLAEQYLIRAEAEANLGQTGPAQTDLNVIRARAGLPNTAATTLSTILTAILHERRSELFTEYGHRWLDLKRTGTVDALMSVVTPEKGGSAWKTTDQLYPIPQSEILADPNLTQNPGY